MWYNHELINRQHKAHTIINPILRFSTATPTSIVKIVKLYPSQDPLLIRSQHHPIQDRHQEEPPPAQVWPTAQPCCHYSIDKATMPLTTLSYSKEKQPLQPHQWQVISQPPKTEVQFSNNIWLKTEKQVTRYLQNRGHRRVKSMKLPCRRRKIIKVQREKVH